MIGREYKQKADSPYLEGRGVGVTGVAICNPLMLGFDGNFHQVKADGMAYFEFNDVEGTLEIVEAVASIDYTSEFLMILPGNDSDFYEVDLTQDKQKELEKVEK